MNVISEIIQENFHNHVSFPTQNSPLTNLKHSHNVTGNEFWQIAKSLLVSKLWNLLPTTNPE